MAKEKTVPASFAFARLQERLGDHTPLCDVVIEIEDGRITRIEDGRAELEGNATLAVPALVNAHDHGYGIRPLDFGVADDALEPFIAGWGMRPRTDAYLEALVAFGRMAQAGIGSTVHLINSHRVGELFEEATSIARAAADIGLRLGLSCPILDRNSWVYGGPQALQPYLADENDWRALMDSTPCFPSATEQVAQVDRIAAALSSEKVSVQYGPIGPQWCEDSTLAQIAEASRENSRRVHMHLLESRRQREWLDAAYPDGIIRFLDQIGLLSPRLAVAHGVQLREAEAELLAERGVTVVSNPSSNLRYRSGVAPLPMLRAKGVRVAFGMDGAALDDDQDMWRELRLAFHLHGGNGLAPDLPHGELLDLALLEGGRVVGLDGQCGALRTGGAADFAVLDLDALLENTLYDTADMGRLLIDRMTAGRVQGLVVAGVPVLAEGKLVGVDYDAACAEFREQCRRGARDMPQRQFATRIQDAVRRYYASGAHLTIPPKS